MYNYTDRNKAVVVYFFTVWKGIFWYRGLHPFSVYLMLCRVYFYLNVNEVHSMIHVISFSNSELHIFSLVYTQGA